MKKINQKINDLVATNFFFPIIRKSTNLVATNFIFFTLGDLVATRLFNVGLQVTIWWALNCVFMFFFLLGNLVATWSFEIQHQTIWWALDCPMLDCEGQFGGH